VEREFYVGVIVSNSHKIKGPVLLFSSEGGSSIEEVSARNQRESGNSTWTTSRGWVEEAEALIARSLLMGIPRPRN